MNEKKYTIFSWRCFNKNKRKLEKKLNTEYKNVSKIKYFTQKN